MNPTDLYPWADPALQQRLIADPRAVLASQGVQVPADLPRAVVDDIVRFVYLIWVDGMIVPRDQFRIDPNDEGLLFGRGVWESTRVVQGEPWLWDAHLERLKRTAELLGLSLDPKRLPNTQQVRDYVGMLTKMDVVLRLNVSAGRAGKTGLVWMSAAAPPTPQATLKLRTCPNPVPKNQPYLVWKTFQYATRLRVGQEAWKEGYDSSLLVDPAGHLLEASHANIFLRLDTGWVTPAIDGGLLPGTVREHLLKNAPLPIRETTVDQAELAHVREAFATNSNIGGIPIVRVDHWDYPVGEETKSLIQWLGPHRR
jgi:branched-subunit amino acid aminotransferase/4-amino-4-deoxychorismate lyase